MRRHIWPASPSYIGHIETRMSRSAPRWIIALSALRMYVRQQREQVHRLGCFGTPPPGIRADLYGNAAALCGMTIDAQLWVLFWLLLAWKLHFCLYAWNREIQQGAHPDRHYLLWISKYASDPADRLDTIQDHRLFLVDLIVFSHSAGPNWDVRALHSGTIRF